MTPRRPAAELVLDRLSARSRRRRPALGGGRSRRWPIDPGSAQERPKELQRFGDEVPAIAAEIGIAIYPNNSRAVAVTSSARHHSVSVKSQ
jgi:hypothetical protein